MVQLCQYKRWHATRWVADYTVKATPVTKIMVRVLELSNVANGIPDAVESNDKIFDGNDRNENHDFRHRRCLHCVVSHPSCYTQDSGCFCRAVSHQRSNQIFQIFF